MRNLKRSIFFPLILGIFLGPLGTGISPFSFWGEARADELALTSGQSQSLKELRIEFQREMNQIRKKMMIRRMELKTLPPQEFRGENGETLRREIRSLMLQSRERSLFYRQEAFKILTPEQQKKLPPESPLGFDCRGWFHHRGGRANPGTGRGLPGSPAGQ